MRKKRRSEGVLNPNEALRGWERFWSKNKVKEFLRAEDGSYARDKDGKLIAIRTDEKRRMPSRPNWRYGSSK